MLQGNLIFAEQQNTMNQNLFMRSNTILDYINKAPASENDNFLVPIESDSANDFSSPVHGADTYTFKKMLSKILDDPFVESAKDSDFPLSERLDLYQGDLQFPIAKDTPYEKEQELETKHRLPDSAKLKEKPKTLIFHDSIPKIHKEKERYSKILTLPVDPVAEEKSPDHSAQMMLLEDKLEADLRYQHPPSPGKDHEPTASVKHHPVSDIA